MRRAAWDRHHDRWEGLLITFSALASGEPRLGLPALDGLFAAGSISDLEAAHLSNRALMEGIYRLAWLRENSGLFQVNWRDMETEELGSVYESLLELTPRLTDDGHALGFAEGGEDQRSCSQNNRQLLHARLRLSKRFSTALSILCWTASRRRQTIRLKLCSASPSSTPPVAPDIFF